MHYMYILRSNKTGQFYIGSTSDLRKRFYQHNSGQSKATKPGIPWELVYYEAFQAKNLALGREVKLKHHGKALTELKKRIGFA